jgi:transglutaminase-like putative cysteine protease
VATRDAVTSPDSLASDWTMSGLILVSIGLAAASLHSVVADVAWWFVLMLVATIVLAAGAIVRSFARHQGWGTLAAFLAAVMTMTLLFSPQNAILGLIPTFDTLGTFREVEAAGSQSIANQGIPANADQGIVYLLCLGVAAIAFVMDTLAFAARAPAFTGVPLVVLLLVPSFINPELNDPFLFTLTAAAWVAILLVRSRPAGRSAALGIASAALASALVLPLVLPSVQPGTASGGPAGVVTTGINPIVNLGDDLRQGEPSLALTYTTTALTGQYLRLTALDDFTGTTWAPTATDVIAGNGVDAIGAAPGLGEAVPRSEVSTDITVSNIGTQWLPAPYAPATVTGLVGDWGWEPDALAIRSDRSNARGQEYTVQSILIAPSIEQLTAAGTVVEPALERYLQVPEDLPSVVGATAVQVVAGATTNYDKALALQDFFRDEFTYSEQAPVDQGYDGSGASVLAAFLDARAGYCVHFSSAMASMARTLGIPARVAVGFTPGEAVTDESGRLVEYRVTTMNLHAWPELYFAGIGWVRFEPTPGRGAVPEFAPLAQDDPATPDVDESVPVPASTSAPTTAPSAAPSLPPEEQPEPGATTTGSTMSVQWWWVALAILVALLGAPWAVRAVRRKRREAQTARGSALAAWDELRDLADDLGLRTSDARTPRQLSADLAAHLDDDGRRALARLRIALESEAFAEQAGDPDPHDLTIVSRSLRRRAGFVQRLAAAALPRSLFASWLPAPSRVE